MKLLLTLIAFLGFLAAQGFAADQSRPNILLILADDLGYGDVRCYNDQSKVATPNLDRRAREGMRFTEAHSPATVCTQVIPHAAGTSLTAMSHWRAASTT